VDTNQWQQLPLFSDLGALASRGWPMKRISQVAFLLGSIAFAHNASAAVITQCGASSGVTYYFEGGAIGADKAGWQKDAATGGFELVANADYSEADIIYENPPPIGPSSYRAEGEAMRKREP
jgi:hypothetical protein